MEKSLADILKNTFRKKMQPERFANISRICKNTARYIVRLFFHPKHGFDNTDNEPIVFIALLYINDLIIKYAMTRFVDSWQISKQLRDHFERSFPE